jgi:hypothetical protein
MGGSTGPGSAFLVESSCLRSKIFSAASELYHVPMSVAFALLPSNWSQFSPFQVTLAIFAEDTSEPRVRFDSRSRQRNREAGPVFVQSSPLVVRHRHERDGVRQVARQVSALHGQAINTAWPLPS